MPYIDLTFSISVILGLAAVVVPSVTTLLNNLHQYQLRKLELKAQQDKELRFYRQTIFENYLKYSLQYLHRIKDSELLYEEYHSLALIYFPDNFLPLVKEILSLILPGAGSNKTECLIILEDLSCKIRNTLERP